MNVILGIGILILLVGVVFEVIIIPLSQKRKINEIINPMKEKYKGTIWESYVQFADIYLKSAKKVESRSSLSYSPFNNALVEVKNVLEFADRCKDEQSLEKIKIPLSLLAQHLDEYNSKGITKDTTKILENLINCNTVLRWRIEDLQKTEKTSNASQVLDYNI